MSEGTRDIVDTSDPTMKIQYVGTYLAGGTKLGEWGVYDVKGQGETLFINGELQSCLQDEYIYHEMFVHPLLIGSRSPRSVLILGGGEGCVVREVLKWPSVESVVQVDWNEDLVGYFKSEGEHWNGGAYRDSRVKLVYKDALKYLEETPDEYDAIFLDLCDPSDTEKAFFELLLPLIRGRLSVNGGCMINAGRVGSQTMSVWLADFLKRLFPNTDYQRAALRVFVPSFLGEWCFFLLGPKNWSLYSHEHTEPPACKRFTRQELIHALSWPKDAETTYTKFWTDVDAVETVKPVVVAPPTPQKLSEEPAPGWAEWNHHGC